MNQRRIVYFRADGNHKIGYGHILRCLALAEMLHENFDCRFVIQPASEFILQEISKYSTNIISIPFFPSIEDELLFLKSLPDSDNAFLVLDGYQFTSVFQENVRIFFKSLIYIDDLVNEPVVADLLINHSAGIKKEDYSHKWYSKFLLGFSYAIIRKAFQPVNLKDCFKVSRVFISMGGADPNDFSLKTIKVLFNIEEVKEIDILVGTQYSKIQELRELAEVTKEKHITIHNGKSAEQVAELMRLSDIGICSASTLAYEYASSGGVLCVSQTVDNQKYLYKYLTELHIAYPFENINVLIHKLKNSDWYNSYIENKRNYFDGKSSQRILNSFLKLEVEGEIKISKASEKDVDLYFHWANDPSTRKYAVNKDSIPYEIHLNWFNSKNKNANAYLYVCTLHEKAIGQVRFDRRDLDFDISYSIDVNQRGKGYGELVLRKAIKRLLHDLNTTIICRGIIDSQNISSIMLFENIGF